MTQEELVQKCNITVRTIQRIEAGETTPRTFTIKTILNALGYEYEKVFEKEYSNFTKAYYSYMGFEAKDFEKVKYKKLVIRDKHNST